MYKARIKDKWWCSQCGRKKRIKLRWALFVTYTIIQSITSSEICALHLTHPSAHTWSSGQPTLRCPGSSLEVRCLAQGSHLSRRQFLPEPRFESTTSGYKSDALSIRATTTPTTASQVPRPELDWSAESQVLIPAEHLWCDLKCKPWAKHSSPNTNDIWVQSFIKLQKYCNRGGNAIFKYMNYVSIFVATAWKCLFSSKEGDQYFCPYNECTSHWCLVMNFWLKVCI